MSLTRVFVYGTLKRGNPNHYLLSDSTGKYGAAQFVGGATLVNKYPLVIFGRYNIPYLLAAEGQGKNVSGELYDVDPKMLAELDDLEKHPELYTRKPFDCILNHPVSSGEEPDKTIRAEIYMLYNFNKSMLSMPFLSDYSMEAAKNKPYSYRENRSAEHNIYSEVKEQ